MSEPSSGRGRKGAAEGGPSPALRVLVVDDDRVDRIAVRRLLAGAGISDGVVEAESVLEAIGKLTTATFDCVVLDFNLPDGDGLTFLLGMRNAGVSVPVIMLTGQGDTGVMIDLFAAGAADYIAKDSLTAERLMQSIAKIHT